MNKTRKGYTHFKPTEVEELLKIDVLPDSTRTASLKQWAKAHNRKMNSVYSKIKALKKQGVVVAEVPKSNSAEVRIPFKTMRIEGNTLVFGF